MTTMLSFRTDERLAIALDAEVTNSGRARSDLLNQALRDFLYRLACERDAEIYARTPLTAGETGVWSNEAWADDTPGTDWSEVFGE